IHDDEVGPGLLVEAVSLDAVGGFGDDREARLLLQHRAITLPNDGGGVDQQDGSRRIPHAARSPGAASPPAATGDVAPRAAAWGCPDLKLSCPPSAATRSRMPSRPMPDLT